MLAIVLPIKDKSDLVRHQALISIVSNNERLRLYVCGNTDDTKNSQLVFIPIKTTSRAVRLNLGVQKALADKNEWIILHHPRSTLVLDQSEWDSVEKRLQGQWGAFTHKFDLAHPLLKFTSWYSNNIRGRYKQIYYLDHCFYLSSQMAKEVFPLKNVDIFEDTLLSLSLRKKSKGALIPIISLTSAIRFQQKGVIKQLLLNIKMKLHFYLKKDLKEMNKEYEKDIELNTDL